MKYLQIGLGHGLLSSALVLLTLYKVISEFTSVTLYIGKKLAPELTDAFIQEADDKTYHVKLTIGWYLVQIGILGTTYWASYGFTNTLARIAIVLVLIDICWTCVDKIKHRDSMAELLVPLGWLTIFATVDLIVLLVLTTLVIKG